MRPGPVPQDLAERFWSKVDQSAGPDACWPWQGSINRRWGYGVIALDGKRTMRAHRLAYQLTFGELPAGPLDHTCHTPKCPGGPSCPHRACCNPVHLECVTQAENIRRGVRGAPTHCKRGHEFTPENTQYYKNGSRHCRECYRQRSRRYWAEGRIGTRKNKEI